MGVIIYTIYNIYIYTIYYIYIYVSGNVYNTIVLPIHWLGNARKRTIGLLFYVIISFYERNFVLTVHTAHGNQNINKLKIYFRET